MSEKKYNERISNDPIDLSPDVYVIVGPDASGKTFYANRIEEEVKAKGLPNVKKFFPGADGDGIREALKKMRPEEGDPEVGKIIFETNIPTSEHRSNVLNLFRDAEEEDAPYHVQLVLTNSKRIEPVDEPFNSFVDFTPPDPTE